MSPESMRVLLAVTNLGGGGAERHVVRLANALEGLSEIEVAVATLRPNGSYEQFLHESITRCVAGPSFSRRSTTASAYFAARPLSKFIQTWKPDVVVSFLQPMSWACARACERLRPDDAPVRVAAVQNNFAHLGLGWSAKRFHSRFARAIETADHVIAISKGVGASLEESLPAVKGKCSVAYNAAVDAGNSELGNYSDACDSIGSHFQPRLVACGRLVPQKGFENLLRAIAVLKSEFDVHLKLLGDGPLRAELEALGRELKISDRVEFAGFVTDPLPEFQAADLFVLSSQWEGFGNVIVESMSVGTPVVATNCPFGPAEIITDEQDGWLADDVSLEGLITAMRRALSCPEQWPRIAHEALVRSRDFSADKIAADYLTILKPVVSEAHRSDHRSRLQQNIGPVS